MQEEAINERLEDGLNPLHRASTVGDTALCNRLLAAGADVNARTGKPIADNDLPDSEWEPGDTALILAAQAGHADIVTLLLEWGADVSIYNSVHWGPLHAAVVGGEVGILQKLIQAGADVSVSCIARGFDEEFGWFFVGTALHVAASWNRPSMAQCLIQSGASISAAWIDRRTPLIYAAARGSTAVVEVLCDHGADPTLREHRHEHGSFLDWTPLHYAARNGHGETVAALLRRGAEPRARDSHSVETAAEMAVDAASEQTG